VDDTGKKLLNLMFRPGEEICVSHNQFSYHSVPLSQALGDMVTLVPTTESVAKRKITLEQGTERVNTSQVILVALNPIEGYRSDINCKAFRNFLVEVDYGPLAAQLEYVRKLGLPYSAVVFSGNKSLHFLISLDQDLPSENAYRVLSEWILKIVTLADQNTQNPSRSIRIPGAWREPKKQQKLVEIRGQTRYEDLLAWLKEHPEAKPKPKEKRKIVGQHDFSKLKQWTVDLLINGLDASKGRNKQWFSIACEFALAGYSEDDTLDILGEFFTPDRDFKEREWKTSVKSGFKYIYDRR
jgi:hypothetical protein